MQTGKPEPAAPPLAGGAAKAEPLPKRVIPGAMCVAKRSCKWVHGWIAG